MPTSAATIKTVSVMTRAAELPLFVTLNKFPYSAGFGHPRPRHPGICPTISFARSHKARRGEFDIIVCFPRGQALGRTLSALPLHHGNIELPDVAFHSRYAINRAQRGIIIRSTRGVLIKIESLQESNLHLFPFGDAATMPSGTPSASMK